MSRSSLTMKLTVEKKTSTQKKSQIVVTRGLREERMGSQWLTTKFQLGMMEKFWTDFPGGPVVKTPFFHCRGHEFDPWSGN